MSAQKPETNTSGAAIHVVRFKLMTPVRGAGAGIDAVATVSVRLGACPESGRGAVTCARRLLAAPPRTKPGISGPFGTAATRTWMHRLSRMHAGELWARPRPQPAARVRGGGARAQRHPGCRAALSDAAGGECGAAPAHD